MTIVVTGATGQLGRLAVEALLRRGADPRDVLATGRDTARLADLASLGVRTAVVDYDDRATLDTAFEGADRVLFVSGSEVGRRIAQHTTVVAAAKAAGVSLLVYTSIPKADTSGLVLAADHLATERLIRESGVPFSLLRNSWYLENYLPQIPTYLEHGVVGSAGEGRVSAATRADYADAAAVVLLADDSAGTVHELGGESFTLAELAAAVADASGREVTYTDVPAEQLTEILVGAGLPRGYAEVLADADTGLARGDLEVTSGDLERLIGRRPTSYREAVAEAVRDLAPSAR
ncbi:NmrA family NAD(P)-binding protein [Oryzobacter sp. R7]|uniref:NmrA family NAD(P)-binding protein n=1 Tax=Oryzobacter faecalis TaxID=3388656 RepID=UPI00398D4FD1